MRSYIIYFIVCFAHIASTQVIYERTYPPVPSLEFVIQLSDTSTVSFANNSPCSFASFLHIDKNGNKINTGGLAGESTHSLGVRSIGGDSILVWCRVGPMDFNGANYFLISLWTPDEYVPLVLDSVHYSLWEDFELPYEAYLLGDDKILYRMVDSLYVRQVSGQQLLKQEQIPGAVYPFLNHIVVWDYLEEPVVLSIDLTEVAEWSSNLLHPVSGFKSMALDSFLVGIQIPNTGVLHLVNGLTEEIVSLDLSSFFPFIEDIQVNDDGLFVKGKSGSLDYLVHINEQAQVINQMLIDWPEIAGPFTYTYYTDRVYGWKTDGLSNYKANYRVAYHYPDADPIEFVDVPLDSIWIDSIFLWPPEKHLPAKLFLKGQVSNNSSDTVYALTYHHEGLQLSQCDPGVYTTFVDGLLIPPGETGIFPMFASSWEVAANEPFYRTYFVQHANNHLDDNKADNHFQLFYFLSSIRPVTENTFSIWPNPFRDYLESSAEFEYLKMYNDFGQLVATGINRLDNLGNLNQGIYYLKGIKNQKTYYSSVIKME